MGCREGVVVLQLLYGDAGVLPVARESGLPGGGGGVTVVMRCDAGVIGT